MSEAVAKRLLTGTAANALDKAMILAVQMLAIPVLSQHWGAAGYGFWLLLMTLPAYASLADFGIGTAAGTEATRCVAIGDFAGARAVLQTAFAFMAIVLGKSLLVGFGVWGLSAMEQQRWVGPIVVTLAYAGVIVLSSIPAMALQATHKYSLSQLIVAATVAVEGAALLAIVGLGGDIMLVLLALLVVRSLGFLVMILLLRHSEPWFALGLGSASTRQFQAIARPSLAVLALTASAVVMLQGMVFTLGLAAGAVAVAGFGAARLLSRIPLQFSGLLLRASQPELTRAAAGADVQLLRRLNQVNVGISVALAPLTIAALTLGGPALLTALSGGRLTASWQVFALLGLSASLNAIWNAAATPLIARNRQGVFAYWALVVSAVAVVAPLLANADQVLAAASAMAFTDALILVVVTTRLRPSAAVALRAKEA